jgi:hypothetical protein
LLSSTRWRTAAPIKLVILCVWMAMVGLWYGMLTGLPSREHVAVPLGNPILGDTAMRAAAVLILGGIVMGLLVRDVVPTTVYPPEAPRNVPPSL